jgi:hypothetical protein
MVKVTKEIEIVIDGVHVEVLKNVFELARRYMSGNLVKREDERTCAEFNGQQVHDMEGLMQKVFDA